LSSEVLTATNTKMADTWDVYRTLQPDDGGSKLLWNVGHYQLDYTVQHPGGGGGGAGTIALIEQAAAATAI
jgi:hypothetical protein